VPQHEPLRADEPPPEAIAADVVASAEWQRVVGSLVATRPISTVDVSSRSSRRPADWFNRTR